MEGRRLPSWMSAPPVKQETSSPSTAASVSCGKDNAAVSTRDKEAEAKELKVNQLPGNVGQKKRGKQNLHDAVKKEREKAYRDAIPRKTTGTRRRRGKESCPSPPDDDDAESKIACNSDIGNEDDVELTEEDLLSIANEYIAAAGNEDSKKFSGEPKKKKKVDGSSSEFPPAKEASVAAFGFEKLSDENKSVVSSSSSSTTGCEDMLNLLLGNLLTKNVT